MYVGFSGNGYLVNNVYLRKCQDSSSQYYTVQWSEIQCFTMNSIPLFPAFEGLFFIQNDMFCLSSSCSQSSISSDLDGSGYIVCRMTSYPRSKPQSYIVEVIRLFSVFYRLFSSFWGLLLCVGEIEFLPGGDMVRTAAHDLEYLFLQGIALWHTCQR